MGSRAFRLRKRRGKEGRGQLEIERRREGEKTRDDEPNHEAGKRKGGRVSMR